MLYYFFIISNSACNMISKQYTRRTHPGRRVRVRGLLIRKSTGNARAPVFCTRTHGSDDRDDRISAAIALTMRHKPSLSVDVPKPAMEAESTLDPAPSLSAAPSGPVTPAPLMTPQMRANGLGNGYFLRNEPMQRSLSVMSSEADEDMHDRPDVRWTDEEKRDVLRLYSRFVDRPVTSEPVAPFDESDPPPHILTRVASEFCKTTSAHSVRHVRSVLRELVKQTYRSNVMPISPGISAPDEETKYRGECLLRGLNAADEAAGGPLGPSARGLPYGRAGLAVPAGSRGGAAANSDPAYPELPLASPFEEKSMMFPGGQCRSNSFSSLRSNSTTTIDYRRRSSSTRGGGGAGAGASAGGASTAANGAGRGITMTRTPSSLSRASTAADWEAEMEA